MKGVISTKLNSLQLSLIENAMLQKLRIDLFFWLGKKNTWIQNVFPFWEWTLREYVIG